MSQIKGEISRERILKNISLDERKSVKFRVSPPVGNNNEEVDESSENEEVNDECNESSLRISSTNNGVENYWFEELEDENFNESSDESELEEDSEELKFLLRRRVHPADNKEAKWKLARLFKPGLKPPNEFMSLFSENSRNS